MALFNSLSQGLIDAWLQSDATTKPESLYGDIGDKLSIKMALSVVTTVEDDPYDWRFQRIRDFGFKSLQLERMRREFPDAVLRDLNRSFIDDAIIPAFSKALQIRRPMLELVKTRLLGVRIGYERIILPQKCDGKPEWCISLIEGRFFVSRTEETKTDMTDDNIVQLLIEGHTSKEIADFLALSPRTIEHRVDRLKDRFEANNLVHLVAKLVAAQLSHKG